MFSSTNKLGIVLAAAMIAFGGCATTPRPGAEIPPMRFHEAITKEVEGVEVRVELLTRDYLLKATAATVRLVRPKDFSEIEGDGYLNYSKEGYDELLILYNRYGQVPLASLYDEFGEEQPLAKGLPVTPYLDDNYQQRIVAFRFVVRNRRGDKVQFDPSQVALITEDGRQWRPLSRRQIMEINHWSRAGRRYGPSRFAAGPAWMGPYSPDWYLKEQILDETLLRSGVVYAGAIIDGIVAFPKVVAGPRYSTMRVVLPGLVLYRGVTPVKEVDLEFEFLLRGASG
jgi:hypothetical protein